MANLAQGPISREALDLRLVTMTHSGSSTGRRGAQVRTVVSMRLDGPAHGGELAHVIRPNHNASKHDV